MVWPFLHPLAPLLSESSTAALLSGAGEAEPLLTKSCRISLCAQLMRLEELFSAKRPSESSSCYEETGGELPSTSAALGLDEVRYLSQVSFWRKGDKSTAGGRTILAFNWSFEPSPS